MIEMKFLPDFGIMLSFVFSSMCMNFCFILYYRYYFGEILEEAVWDCLNSQIAFKLESCGHTLSLSLLNLSIVVPMFPKSHNHCYLEKSASIFSDSPFISTPNVCFRLYPHQC